MDMDVILKYAGQIGKILSIGVSVFAVVWAIVAFTKTYIERMKIAIENKDWEQMITIVQEFVLAAEQKFLDEKGSGAKKKEEVVNLLKSYGYEITSTVDALIEAIVYKQFNSNRNKEK